MKKLLVIACATSALALASGAYAQGIPPGDTYRIDITGVAGSFCTIASASASASGAIIGGVAPNGVAGPTNGSTTFTYPLGKSTHPTGALKANSGSVTLTVNENNACRYTLSSLNGGLQGTKGYIPLAYMANLNTNNPQTARGSDFDSVTIPADLVGGAQQLTVNYSILAAPGTALAPDTYTDTLTVNIYPS